MKKKITSEAEFFAHNPSARKEKLENFSVKDKGIKQNFIQEQKNKKVVDKIKIFFSKKKEKKKNYTSASNYWNRFSQIFKKKEKEKNHTGFSNYWSRFSQISKKKWYWSFACFLILVGLGFGGWFYLEDRKEIVRLQNTIEYLESKKQEVISLQKAVHLQYLPIEKSIENILNKMELQSSSFQEISNSVTEKKLSFFVNDINYQKFIQLIFELENASPTLILNKVKIAAIEQDKLNVFLEISGLI